MSNLKLLIDVLKDAVIETRPWESMRFCSKCHSWLNFKNFNKNAASKDGFQAYCKDCMHEMYIERQKDIENRW